MKCFVLWLFIFLIAQKVNADNERSFGVHLEKTSYNKQTSISMGVDLDIRFLYLLGIEAEGATNVDSSKLNLVSGFAKIQIPFQSILFDVTPKFGYGYLLYETPLAEYRGEGFLFGLDIKITNFLRLSVDYRTGKRKNSSAANYSNQKVDAQSSDYSSNFYCGMDNQSSFADNLTPSNLKFEQLNLKALFPIKTDLEMGIKYYEIHYGNSIQSGNQLLILLSY